MPDDDTGQEKSKAPRFELEQSDSYNRYLLQSKSEIDYVLRALYKAGSLITVYFNAGNDFLLTSLVDFDEGSGRLVFDMGADEEMNQRALQAERLIFVASLDKVKIQFALQGVREETTDGRPAMVGERPERLLRLQRREYFRLTTPVARPLKCTITLPEDGQRVELSVLDISGGGLAVVIPPESIDFDVAQVFAHCRIELPEEGHINAPLEVRNIFEVTLRNGARVRRSGCQFVDLPEPMLSRIQRYITRVERERKARESGMG